MPEGVNVISYSSPARKFVEMPVTTASVSYSLRLPEKARDEMLPWSLGADIRDEATKRGADTVFVSPIERRQLAEPWPPTGEPVKWGQAYCYVAFGKLRELAAT